MHARLTVLSGHDGGAAWKGRRDRWGEQAGDWHTYTHIVLTSCVCIRRAICQILAATQADSIGRRFNKGDIPGVCRRAISKTTATLEGPHIDSQPAHAELAGLPRPPSPPLLSTCLVQESASNVKSHPCWTLASTHANSPAVIIRLESGDCAGIEAASDLLVSSSALAGLDVRSLCKHVGWQRTLAADGLCTV